MAESTRADALCVRVLWGERTVATHVLHAGQSLNLASNGEPLPRQHAPVRFDVTKQHFEVGFAEGVVGELYRNGETELSLGEVVHRGMAVESDDGGWTCALGRTDVLRLGRGPVWLEASRVKAPTRAVAPLSETVDYPFLNTLLVCFALFSAIALHAEFNVEADDLDDSVATDVARMRHVLVQAEKPQPKKVAVNETKTPTKDPIKRTVAEGSPRPPSKPVKDPGGNNQLAAKELVGRIFGGRGAAGIVGPGGLGKDIAGALGNMVAANGNGNGGWSIKGDGAGGQGGDPTGIGAIPTSGVKNAKGIGELCRGPGPCKKTFDPVIEPGPAMVCTGDGGTSCMDKELIRKVIASHRDQIRFCYELALQQAPSLSGKVAVGFMVSSAGTVPTANVVTSSVSSDALGDCLVSRVRSWQFPVAKAAGGYRVTYPFVFKPSGG